jgi:hypothetical protein
MVNPPACSKKARCSEFAYPDNYNCFMAAKQGKKDYPTMVLNILGTSVAALPLDEEIRSQKSEPVLWSLIYEWQHEQ